MRLLYTFLCIIMIFSLIICGTPNVFAEETPTQNGIDYAIYDWENLNFSNIDSTTWASMRDWLLTSAKLDTVFLVARKATDYYKNDICSVISVRFVSSPDAVLYAMAKEGEATWKEYSKFIIREQYDWENMAKLLESIRFSEPNAEKAYEILAFMIDYAEELYRTEITNPKTGDPVGVAVALLALSGIGGGLMIWRKKSSRYAA